MPTFKPALSLEHGCEQALKSRSPYHYMKSRLSPPTDEPEEIEKYQELIHYLDEYYTESEEENVQ